MDLTGIWSVQMKGRAHFDEIVNQTDSSSPVSHTRSSFNELILCRAVRCWLTCDFVAFRTMLQSIVPHWQKFYFLRQMVALVGTVWKRLCEQSISSALAIVPCLFSWTRFAYSRICECHLYCIVCVCVCLFVCVWISSSLHIGACGKWSKCKYQESPARSLVYFNNNNNNNNDTL